MFLYLYSLLYNCTLFLAKGLSFFSPKVKLFLKQRSQWRSSLKKVLSEFSGKNTVWFHCASLGEFEQARPLIEKYRATYPDAFIGLTFFSASGYSVQKKYPHANWVGYLPLDRKKDLNDFIAQINPGILFLIKYEFWPQLISRVKQKNIPIYSISSIFRPTQLFFKPWHFGLRSILKKIDHFYVQNETSIKLLQSIGIQQCTLTGDTRFDRVLEIAEKKIDLPKIEDFSKNEFCFVAGSTWPEDHEMILPTLQKENQKVIVAPHKIDEDTLKRIEEKLEVSYIRWSQYETKDANKRVLILDCIGLLSKVYKYADLSYVGGGFGNSGLHNTLEPAIFGIPVIIGPNYKKFDEAVGLVDNKGTFSVEDAKEFEAVLVKLTKSEEETKKIGQRNKKFVEKSAGAVRKIFSSLNQK